MANEDMPAVQPPAEPDTSVPLRARRRSGPRSKTSIFLGVTKYKRTGRWESHIWWSDGRSTASRQARGQQQRKQKHGCQLHLGSFTRAPDAGVAYDRAAIRFRGNAAAVNFPEIDYGKDRFMLEHGHLPKRAFVQCLRTWAQEIDTTLHMSEEDERQRLIRLTQRPDASGSQSCTGVHAAAAAAKAPEADASLSSFSGSGMPAGLPELQQPTRRSLRLQERGVSTTPRPDHLPGSGLESESPSEASQSRRGRQPSKRRKVAAPVHAAVRLGDPGLQPAPILALTDLPQWLQDGAREPEEAMLHAAAATVPPPDIRRYAGVGGPALQKPPSISPAAWPPAKAESTSTTVLSTLPGRSHSSGSMRSVQQPRYCQSEAASRPWVPQPASAHPLSHAMAAASGMGLGMAPGRIRSSLSSECRLGSARPAGNPIRARALSQPTAFSTLDAIYEPFSLAYGQQPAGQFNEAGVQPHECQWMQPLCDPAAFRRAASAMNGAPGTADAYMSLPVLS